MDTQPQRRDTEIAKDDSTNELKVIVVLVYGAMGAGIAANPAVDARYSPFPITAVPHLETPAWILMGAVLTLAISLSRKGKRSASWAVIAFGALSVGFVKLFATELWYSYDVLLCNWLGVTFALAVVSVLVVWGLKKAVQGKWVSMLGISLMMLAGMAWLAILLNYTLLAYAGRHPNSEIRAASSTVKRRN